MKCDCKLKEWKWCVGFENYYYVNNLGVIKRLPRYIRYSSGKLVLHKGGEIAYCKKKNGYLGVTLCMDGTGKIDKMVHRLVAEAFIPNPENKSQVNHKDGNKFNNCVCNLEWVTPSENVKHSFDKLGRKSASGKSHYASKPIVYFDESGKEICRFFSIKEASDVIGKSEKIIAKICKDVNNKQWMFL